MYDIERASHSVRISIGFDITKEDLNFVIDKIVRLENRLKERDN